MSQYDIVIIGGGISSLYFLLKYYHSQGTLNNILLIEQFPDVGGRIYTKTVKVAKQSFTYELGAGRFRKSHHRLMDIIRFFGMNDKLIPNGKDALYIVKDILLKNWIVQHKDLLEIEIEKSNQPFRFRLKNNNYIHYLFIKLLTSIDISTLYQYTIDELCHKYLNDFEKAFLYHIFAYSGQFTIMNALDFYLNSYDDYFMDKQYYSLKGGLSSLVNHLKDFLLSNHLNLNVKEKCLQVIKIPKGYKIYTDKGVYHSKKIILNVAPHRLINIKGTRKFDALISMIQPKPLFRIYAIYPSHNVWFKDLPRIITNSPIRTIIPIDKTRGLVMISYTDAKYAKEMNTHYQKGKSHVIHYLQTQLKAIFPKRHIPKPIYIDGLYWVAGVNYWKKGGFGYKYAQLQYLKRNNMYLMGEAYSNKQAWIEGALQSAEMILGDIIQN